MSASRQILVGDCREVLAGLEARSVDAVVTDPPYGLSFMSRGWDRAVPGPEYWEAVLRVLKPGGHLVAFGAPRLYHRLACAIEDAGFELRDCLMWLFAQGFPKNHRISLHIDKKLGATGHRAEAIRVVTKTPEEQRDLGEPGELGAYQPATPEAARFEGWGTALAPAYEPILLARKPLEGTVAENALKHGTGGIHIDACKLPSEGGKERAGEASQGRRYSDNGAASFAATPGPRGGGIDGRWPKNLILSCFCDGSDHDPGCPVFVLDEQAGERTSGSMRAGADSGAKGACYGDFRGRVGQEITASTGSASRFFFCAKASKAEREAGLELFDALKVSDGRQTPNDTPYLRDENERKNIHPTVKPIELMRWLIRLITPPGGTVLDPFLGSGSTLCAAALEGVNAIGIELDPEGKGYPQIAEARAKYWQRMAQLAPSTRRKLKKSKLSPRQVSLFDAASEEGAAA